ncbi:kinesin-II 95 kDa subunit-like protein [Jimgerdemannia flammicorona]|uniref:Kinesin-II 95 kDa subunit-like protein n=1 Tax=Jimgerdemannia flammicorona TaxID=994334 RepID=A0A433PAV6_9FUNG|nr:kinesin-II 95 kDa subunit-like protein [Jimgerdemannia flammicorona]
MAGNNIKVVCRFRPQNKLEISEGGVPIINIDDEGTSVQLQGQEFQGPPFAFDKVFGMDSKQKDIFDYSIKSIVDDVVGGYNGTVFAYGQTGSGKTFSMMVRTRALLVLLRNPELSTAHI